MSSTSVKELSPIQILFKRPAFAVGIFLIIAMIAVKPSYNAVAVLLAIPLYLILHQCRGYIYRLGIGRYDFLAFLFYGSFLLSGFINWESKDVGTWAILQKIHLSDLITNMQYQDDVKNWFIDNLDSLIHWKMIVFTPAIAAILYLIFVEFDRKAIKMADLQALGLTDGDVYQRGSIIESLGMIAFMAVSFCYGVQYAIGAMVVLAIFAFVRTNLCMIFAVIASASILLLNYAHFEYITFLSFPNYFINISFNDGVWHAIQLFMKAGISSGGNIGQWYILVPYITMMGLITWQCVRKG